MKRALTYVTCAIFAGILLMLVPLITVAGIRIQDHTLSMTFAMAEGMEKLEGRAYDLGSQNYPLSTEVGVFAASFLFALTMYLWFRRKIPHEYKWARFPPY